MDSVTRKGVGAALVTTAAVMAVTLGCGTAPERGSAEELYVRLGCARCHGDDRGGTRTAPPLHDLGARWTEDELVAYFKTPAPFRSSKQQLQYVAEHYAVDMPAIVGASDEELRRVAVWVLNDQG